jgi:hypothetical protein
MSKKNLLYTATELVVKQMEIVQKCNDTEIQTEITRMEHLSKAATAVSVAADTQAKTFIATGVLPQNNVLFSEDERIFTKELAESKPLKSKGLLVDEFTRK